ncbi:MULTISPECIES: Maf family protein [Luteimonas]|uniref:Maf family protein n=1 Tax=Luteimonas TaxID=83614 RepID=UPI000C7D84AE|nr:MULTISPECIES: nucleoside triphosphate pyrophosphatase [Luteimonas]
MSHPPAPRLVLGSTSPYRRELLQRLQLPFECVRPDFDETPRAGEAPSALAARLAADKAREVASRVPGAWSIGSDQVAELEGEPIGKPGHRAAAIAQLSAMSGRTVRFHTAVALARDDGGLLETMDCTEVRFRVLDAGTIARYVDLEQPFDCAGSFKCEGLGIALFDAIRNDDPTALVGLPLIATARLLRSVGFACP